jgi:hypothetical protein
VQGTPKITHYARRIAQRRYREITIVGGGEDSKQTIELDTADIADRLPA